MTWVRLICRVSFKETGDLQGVVVVNTFNPRGRGRVDL